MIIDNKTIHFPAQCKCGHLYLEKFIAKQKDGLWQPFCWCGFCHTRFNLKKVDLPNGSQAMFLVGIQVFLMHKKTYLIIFLILLFLTVGFFVFQDLKENHFIKKYELAGETEEDWIMVGVVDYWPDYYIHFSKQYYSQEQMQEQLYSFNTFLTGE